MPAAALAVSGGALLIISRLLPLANYPLIHLDFTILSFLLLFFGATIFAFGSSLMQSNRFAWLLLLLLIPLPSRIVDAIVTFFQYGSAEVVNLLFQLIGMTFIREGLTYHTPAITIYIATECSGFRSSTALFITALLAGHLFLKTWYGKFALILFVIPLTLLKNGIRITALTFLSNKFTPLWITDSKLHHEGGIVFFLVILLFLFALIFAIGKLELVLFKPHPPVPNLPTPEKERTKELLPKKSTTQKE